jgi:type IV secretory pathway VirB2 component (pilin)
VELIGGFTASQVAIALVAALGSAFVRGLTGFGMAILLVAPQTDGSINGAVKANAQTMPA